MAVEVRTWSLTDPDYRALDDAQREALNRVYETRRTAGVWSVCDTPLARLRVSFRLSQYQISLRLGIPESTYHGYESGRYQIPAAVVASLSELFGIDVREFLAQQ